MKMMQRCSGAAVQASWWTRPPALLRRAYSTASTTGNGGGAADTAHQAWDHKWATSEGRQAWLRPAPAVVDAVSLLRAHGATRALDLGCGVGRHSLFLAQQGLTVYAVDASPNGLDFAERQIRGQGYTVMRRDNAHQPSGRPHPKEPFVLLHQAKMMELPRDDDWQFDYVLSWNVIYHGDGAVVRKTLEEINRVLSRGPGLFQATFLTKKNALYGKGQEIAENTFVIPDSDDEDKRHPHFYVDKTALEDMLGSSGFAIHSLAEVDHKPGEHHWHWELIAKTKGK